MTLRLLLIQMLRHSLPKRGRRLSWKKGLIMEVRDQELLPKAIQVRLELKTTSLPVELLATLAPPSTNQSKTKQKSPSSKHARNKCSVDLKQQWVYWPMHNNPNSKCRSNTTNWRPNGTSWLRSTMRIGKESMGWRSHSGWALGRMRHRGCRSIMRSYRRIWLSVKPLWSLIRTWPRPLEIRLKALNSSSKERKMKPRT